MFEDAVRVVIVRGQWAAVYDSWGLAKPDVEVRDRLEVMRPDGSLECYEAVATVMDSIAGGPGWHPVRRQCYEHHE
jgi:hypothetical protein